jgi:cytoskeletal protein RodZ
MANSDRQSSKKPPWHQAQDLESVSFGTWLRRQREARTIELREIADHTKISIRYLEALENDRFEVLPAPVFTKGFLRQYGRYIGLDPDQVVNTYLNALQEGDAVEGEDPSPRGRSGTNRAYGVLLVIAAIVLLGLVGYLTFMVERRDSGEDVRPPIAAPPIERPEPLAGSTPETGETSTAPLVVTLDFVDDSWLETEVDGVRQLSEQVGKGESRRIHAQEAVVLTLGNRDGVLVDVNGSPYDLPESEGGETVVEITLPSVDGPGSTGLAEDSR